MDWTKTESPLFNEWATAMREETRLEEARAILLDILETRFGPVPNDLCSTIQQQPSPTLLRHWVRQASRMDSLDNFRVYLRP